MKFLSSSPFMLFWIGVWILSCADLSEPYSEEQYGVDIEEIAPESALLGTEIRLTGNNFHKLAGDIRINFNGTVTDSSQNPVSKSFDIYPAQKNSTAITLKVDANFLLALGTDSATFTGDIAIVSFNSGQRVLLSVFPKTIQFERNLVPVINGFSQNPVVSLGERVEVSGANFIGHDEGNTRLTIKGVLTRTSGGTILVDETLASEFEDRSRVLVYLHSGVFGLSPGEFNGIITVENVNSQEESALGNALEIPALKLALPTVISFQPNEVSRGKKLSVAGYGFLKPDRDRQEYTTLRFEGILRTTETVIEYYDENSLEVAPSVVNNEQLDYVLRVTQAEEGNLTGIGLFPGEFQGTLTPIVYGQGDFIEGTPFPANFVITPQLQMVYLKYLPGFTDSLREFGLRDVSYFVKQAILEGCFRDYAGVNIYFVENPPTGYVDYNTIEIGGLDPNGAGLFGLDNTTGKDEGNVRFNDYIGGYNPETADMGYYSYGGVFVESLLGFSPTLDYEVELSIQSHRFDDIFGYFIEALGGTAVQAKEYPSGSRSPLISEAVRVIGNLISHTVIHEIGHSLGLTNIPGQYHSVGKNGWIMDSGENRNFIERAILDGAGPLTWSPEDAEYLKTILPQY